MIATIGEALVDLIEQPTGHFQACLGGSVYNFTLGLAKQGSPATYLNPLSVDKFGSKFSSQLTANGVNLGEVQASSCPTSLAVVSLDSAGTPTYAFYRENVADRDITVAKAVSHFPEKMQLLHTGGLALVGDAEKIFAVMNAAKEKEALISLDANLRPVAVKEHEKYFKDVMHAIRHSHIVKVSDEDLGILGLGELSLSELSKVLFNESNAELIAVTLGARGAALLTRTLQVEIPAPSGLQVVDTVGAGDCFHAGLITYLYRAGKLASLKELRKLEHGFLVQALQHAIASASINIMRTGCQPPTWQEAQEFIR